MKVTGIDWCEGGGLRRERKESGKRGGERSGRVKSEEWCVTQCGKSAMLDNLKDLKVAAPKMMCNILVRTIFGTGKPHQHAPRSTSTTQII